MLEKILKEMDDHIKVMNNLIRENAREIDAFCRITLEKIGRGGKIFLVGNGGSAADCQHLAAEFTGRFKNNRVPLPAIALTTDTSAITAIGNDFGFEYIFSRQVEALCCEKDILVAISTSGHSRNIVLAVNEARSRGVFVVGLLGRDGGALRSLVDLPIIVTAGDTARIQECHILIGHILSSVCDEYYSINSQKP